MSGHIYDYKILCCESPLIIAHIVFFRNISKRPAGKPTLAGFVKLIYPSFIVIGFYTTIASIKSYEIMDDSILVLKDDNGHILMELTK